MESSFCQTKGSWSYPNPRTKNLKEHKIQRIVEFLPGFFTWFTIIGMFFFSWLIPTWTAIFIILYDVYWIHRTIYISTYSILAYRKMKRWMKIDWFYRLHNIYRGKDFLKEISAELRMLEAEYKKTGFFKYGEKKQLKQKIFERENFLKRAGKDLENKNEFISWKEIYHVIMLPNAMEGAEIIEPAIEAIFQANYPKDRIIILLAMEERVPANLRRNKEKILRDKYSDKFFDFLVTTHKVSKKEMKCKASNTTYAAKQLKKYLEKKKIPLENVILSNFDCDTQIHPQYLAALTYEYITEPNRLKFAYQPLPMYHNNLWETIAPVRVIVTGSSFWHMVESMRPEHMVTFSSHSEPFKTIVDVDYWPVNVISEDSVIFWKGYDYYNGNYKVKPIYLPVSLDAVLGNNYWHTIKNQYKQKRRWAYGIENLPILTRAFLKNKKIKFRKKLKHFLVMLEGHHSWATAPLMLALLGWLPLILGNERFNESVLAHNLPYITRFLMTLAMLGIIISIARKGL